MTLQSSMLFPRGTPIPSVVVREIAAGLRSLAIDKLPFRVVCFILLTSFPGAKFVTEGTFPAV